MDALIEFRNIFFPNIVSVYPSCIIDESNSNAALVTIRLSLLNDVDAENFKLHLSSVMHVEWIVYHNRPQPQKVIFSKAWHCQHSKKNKSENSSRNVDCKATLKILIKKVNRNTKKNDKYLTYDPPLAAEVKIGLMHCHSTTSATALKQLRVNEKVQQQYFDYFSSGLSPADAIRCHENKFLYEEDFVGLANASINPTKVQVQHLYRIWKQLNYELAPPLEMLKEKVELYKSNGATVEICNVDPWSVLIVTQLMQRLHSLPNSSEMIFVDTTCSCESSGTSLTVLLTSTKVGALPLAVIIHPYQTFENYFSSFSLLKENFPFCFGGQTQPNLFMTDDSAAEKKALKSVWPESHQLLCQFHVAQAEWRWLFSHKEIKKEDKPRLMKLFQAVMYAKTEKMLEEAMFNLLKEEGTYPKFVRRFLSFYNRREEWVLLYRENFITRGNNTNNYAEVTIRILKDIVLRRTKAFNVVALTDFCISVWEPHLMKKLLEFAYSRRGEVQILYRNFLKKTKEFIPDDVRSLDENTFLVNGGSKNAYTVNIDIGWCSCPSGFSGAFCKHQFYLMKEKNIQFCNAPAVSAEDKYKLAALALGSKCPPPSFFQNFCDNDEMEISQNFTDFTNFADLKVEHESIHEDGVMSALASPEDIEIVRTEMTRLNNLVNESMKKTSAIRLARNLQQINNISDFDKLYFFKSRRQKIIRVQPPSISRRPAGLTRSGLRLPAGRHRTEIANKGKKRKRSLKENIEKNQCNAKSHGLNH